MGMYVLNLTDCESVFLLDLIRQLLCDSDQVVSENAYQLPSSMFIDLTGVDIKNLRSILDKLSPCLD